MVRLKPTITIGGVKVDVRLALSIMLATTLLMLCKEGYGPFNHRAYDQFFLFLVVPVLFVIVVFWENPANYGLCIGRWREGLVWTFSVCACLAVVLWLVSRRPEISHWYKGRQQPSILNLIWLSGMEMCGWEYILRGFLLFACARALGPGPAIFIQMIPFALLHIGKADIETFSTVFSGVGLGFIAWRTQSFLYTFLIHWFMLTFIVLASTGRLG